MICYVSRGGGGGLYMIAPWNSYEISFTQNLMLKRAVYLNFTIEHGSESAVLYANFIHRESFCGDDMRVGVLVLC